MTATAIQLPVPPAPEPVPAAAPHQCPPWAAVCDPDVADPRYVYHCSGEVPMRDTAGAALSVTVAHDVDPDTPSNPVVQVATDRDSVSLAPTVALNLAWEAREAALVAAWPDGVEIAVTDLRLGDEILTPFGWQAVEYVFVDGWVDPNGRAVAVAVTITEKDEDALGFPLHGKVMARAKDGGA